MAVRITFFLELGGCEIPRFIVTWDPRMQHQFCRIPARVPRSAIFFADLERSNPLSHCLSLWNGENVYGRWYVTPHERGWDSGPRCCICNYRGKYISPIFPRPNPIAVPRKVSRIRSYDDLLLPEHRLLAQIAVGASGEYADRT